MGGSAVCKLLNAAWLSDSQFDLVCRLAEESGRNFQENLRHERLIRRLRAAGSTDLELVEDCIDARDSAAQEFLMTLSWISRDQMRRLAEVGATKRVRNCAWEHTNRKSRWDD